MGDTEGHRLFRRLDRAFWLIWLGYPALIALMAAEILAGPERLEGLSAAQRACLDTLPQVSNFSLAGAIVFWGLFAAEFAVYAILLLLAHRVIRGAAAGRTLVAPMVDLLRSIGLVIAVWPVAELVVSNGALWFWARTGDLPGFTPALALDLPVLGVGLLLLAVASALREAVRLREDAELTI